CTLEEELLDTYREWAQDVQKHCAEFESQVIKAVWDFDESFLKNLLKAVQSPSLPEQEMEGYEAQMIAFNWLFDRRGFRTREEWPNKKTVNFVAKQILGHGLTERQLTAGLKKACLWELPEAPKTKKQK